MSPVLTTYLPAVTLVSPPMKKLAALVLALALVPAVGCDKKTDGPSPFANELRATPGAPVARGGKTDDGIKPVSPAAGTAARVGTADDTIKPAPITPTGKAGGSDDSIRPVGPAGTVARGGKDDDSIKPLPAGPVGPAPARTKP